MLRHFGELARGGREIEEKVALELLGFEGSELLGQAAVGLLIAEISLAIEQVFRELLPLRSVDIFRAREFFERVTHFIAPTLVRLFAPGETDDANRIWQLLLDEQVKQGRD